MIKEVDGKEFERVINTDGTVLVEFYASWCSTCQVMAPTIEKIAEENPNITIVKMSIETAPDITAKYRVKSVPTLLFFRGGEIVKRIVGMMEEDELEEILKSIM